MACWQQEAGAYSDISLNHCIIKYWPQKGIRQMKESVEDGQRSNANWP